MEKLSSKPKLEKCKVSVTKELKKATGIPCGISDLI